MIPAARMGSPEEVAHAVDFLMDEKRLILLAKLSRCKRRALLKHLGIKLFVLV